MEFILWIIAVILVIAGIVSLVRGQLLWGIVLIVVGLLVGLVTGGSASRLGDLRFRWAPLLAIGMARGIKGLRGLSLAFLLLALPAAAQKGAADADLKEISANAGKGIYRSGSGFGGIANHPRTKPLMRG